MNCLFASIHWKPSCQATLLTHIRNTCCVCNAWAYLSMHNAPGDANIDATTKCEHPLPESQGKHYATIICRVHSCSFSMASGLKDRRGGQGSSYINLESKTLQLWRIREVEKELHGVKYSVKALEIWTNKKKVKNYIYSRKQVKNRKKQT